MVISIIIPLLACLRWSLFLISSWETRFQPHQNCYIHCFSYHMGTSTHLQSQSSRALVETFKIVCWNQYCPKWDVHLHSCKMVWDGTQTGHLPAWVHTMELWIPSQLACNPFGSSRKMYQFGAGLSNTFLTLVIFFKNRDRVLGS